VTPDQQDAEALAYELAAEEEVTSAYTAELAAAVAAILAASALVAAGQMAASSLGELVHRLLAPITPRMRGPLFKQTAEGYFLGRRQGFDTLGMKVPQHVSATADLALRQAVDGIDPAARAVLDEAERLADLLDLEQEDNVLTVTSKVTSSGKGAEGTTRWAANRALNAGIADAARRAGVRLLWAAERNACLKCLAYSGLVVKPGEVFPVGLTLGTGKSTLGGVPYSPLHRYCRCRVRPYAGPDATQLGTDEASGLMREANRTIARGWSDYASKPERLRAVDLLLKRGFALPKTVLARAERDLRRGSFSQRHRPRTPLNS
jgi:hypothetical protein